jgi:hypothetical protein
MIRFPYKTALLLFAIVGAVQTSPQTTSFGMVGTTPLLLSSGGEAVLQGTAIFVP